MFYAEYPGKWSRLKNANEFSPMVVAVRRIREGDVERYLVQPIDKTKCINAVNLHALLRIESGHEGAERRDRRLADLDEFDVAGPA